MTASPTSYINRMRTLRLPRVCVAITDSDPTALVDKAETLIRDNTFLEFRLDYLPRPALALPKIKQLDGIQSASHGDRNLSPCPQRGQVSGLCSLAVGHPGERLVLRVASSSISSCRAPPNANPSKSSGSADGRR